MDTHEITGTVKEVAGKVEKNYGQLKSKTRETADRLAGIAGEQGNISWDTTMALVQDHPATSIGIGFLIGAGVGALLTYLARD